MAIMYSDYFNGYGSITSSKVINLYKAIDNDKLKYICSAPYENEGVNFNVTNSWGESQINLWLKMEKGFEEGRQDFNRIAANAAQVVSGVGEKFADRLKRFREDGSKKVKEINSQLNEFVNNKSINTNAEHEIKGSYESVKIFKSAKINELVPMSINFELLHSNSLLDWLEGKIESDKPVTLKEYSKYLIQQLSAKIEEDDGVFKYDVTNLLGKKVAFSPKFEKGKIREGTLVMIIHNGNNSYKTGNLVCSSIKITPSPYLTIGGDFYSINVNITLQLQQDILTDELNSMIDQVKYNGTN